MKCVHVVTMFPKGCLMNSGWINRKQYTIVKLIDEWQDVPST